MVMRVTVRVVVSSPVSLTSTTWDSCGVAGYAQTEDVDGWRSTARKPFA